MASMMNGKEMDMCIILVKQYYTKHQQTFRGKGVTGMSTYANSTQSVPSQDDNAAADTTAAKPTFFNGSYFISTTQGKPELTNAATKRSIFNYSSPRWNYLFTSTNIVLDLLSTLIALFIAVEISSETSSYLEGDMPVFGSRINLFIPMLCLLWLISLIVCSIYARHTMGEGYALYSKIISAAFVYFIVLCTMSYLFNLGIPRSLTTLVPILTPLLCSVERMLMRKSLQHRRDKGEYNYPTVVVGSPAGIRRTIQRLERAKALGYAPIAVCPVMASSQPKSSPAAQVLMPVDFQPKTEAESKLRVLRLNSHLPQIAKRLGARTVLIADVITRNSETMRTLALAVESMGIELAISTSVADLSGAALKMRNDPTMPVLTARLPQYSFLTKVAKRAMDIVCSLFGLIISSPILLIVALLIKHEDGGKIIYSQTRIGIYGEPFTMYKFRSMKENADALKAQLAKEYGLEDRFIFKMKNDPRITRIGHFIRKTSLDEFPQFFNVLKGDMSLVGPRPPLPEEVERYETLYSTRLLVKPGITGPWQVSGRSDLSKEQSEFADVSYIQNWSLTGDLAIIFKTVSAVVRGSGSY